jgi:pimeloyl-ACP methyl ester carboxylesterase
VTGRRRTVVGGVACVLALLTSVGAMAEGPVLRLPVLLVYGFQPAPGFVPTRVWEAFAERLSGRSIGDAERQVIGEGHVVYSLAAADAAHFDVYLSHYAGSLEPTVRDLRYYAARLADEIAWVRNETGAAAVDIVAHSMGGLVARCYVEAGDFTSLLGEPEFDDYGTTYRDDVRTLVALATPHGGTGFAALGSWLGPLIAELAPESRLLQALNAIGEHGTALAPSVRYVSMAGQSCFGCGLRRDARACQALCIEDGLTWSGSDLVVSMSSAFLAGAENTACLGMDHIAMHVHPVLADAVAAVLAGNPAPAVLCADPTLDPSLLPAANADEASSPAP